MSHKVSMITFKKKYPVRPLRKTLSFSLLLWNLLGEAGVKRSVLLRLMQLKWLCDSPIPVTYSGCWLSTSSHAKYFENEWFRDSDQRSKETLCRYFNSKRQEMLNKYYRNVLLWSHQGRQGNKDPRIINSGSPYPPALLQLLPKHSQPISLAFVSLLLGLPLEISEKYKHPSIRSCFKCDRSHFQIHLFSI